MTKAFPPRRTRGSSWTALAVFLALAAPLGSPSLGQDPKGKADAGVPKAKGDEAPKAETKAEPAKAAPVQATAESTDSLDRWEDPRAAAALSNMYEFKAALVNPADTLVINQLATGQGATNLGAIDRYVKSWAAELTEKATLDALINLDGNPVKARDLEVAAQSLLKPLNPPLSSANQRFRQQYVAKMTEVFKPILKGNLHSRTMAMIILSRTGDPQVLPTFTAHLSDPEQLAIVKLLSAVGITNAAKNARNSLDGTSAVAAARALSGFLRREPETFWPAQFRALEALGWLRLATDSPQDGKAEIADTAAAFLLDPKANVNVRVWAAWALGMMQVPVSVQNYNFSRVAHAAGTAAVDLGETIAGLPNASLVDRGHRFIDSLVQLNLAFSGDPEVRNSGLTHANNPAASSALAYMTEIHTQVRAVTKAAIELSNAAGTQFDPKRKALRDAIDQLKAFLAKPPSGGASLYAGGPALAVPKGGSDGGDKR